MRRICSITLTLAAVPFVTALLTPGLTGAAPALATPAASAGSPGWVVGHVVDAGGEPIAGALVNALDSFEVPERAVLPGGAQRSTVTDAQGAFRVRQPAGGYLVEVCEQDLDFPGSCTEAAAGAPYVVTYVGPDAVTDSWVLQQHLWPTTSDQVDIGTIEVMPKGELGGTITGAARGLVEVMRLNDTVAFRTVADNRGGYDFDGLVPGRYYVRAGGDGWLPWRSAIVTVPTGDAAVIDGALRRGASIRGRLTEGARPAAGVDVGTLHVGAGPVAATTTDAHGRYLITGLSAGRYRISVLAGSVYRPATSSVTVPAEATVRTRLAVRRGATITVPVRLGNHPEPDVNDELRDAHGRVVQLLRGDGDGDLVYPGVGPGTYTVVAAHGLRYGTHVVHVHNADIVTTPLRLRKHTLTMTGRTVPGAVVEVTTSGSCPPSRQGRRGAFQAVSRAGADGRFRVTGLVPGTVMVAAEKAPSYVPSCQNGVVLRHDIVRDMPLAHGAVVRGRLVYDGTADPVITPLSFELGYRSTSPHDPTAEHPARARTVPSTGSFTVSGLRGGTATGFLATEAGEDINDVGYQVVYPFQDGTPYWLSMEPRTVKVPTIGTLDLGDLSLVVHEGPVFHP